MHNFESYIWQAIKVYLALFRTYLGSRPNKAKGFIAIAFLSITIGSVCGLRILPEYTVLFCLPSLILFTTLVLPSFIQAAFNPNSELIQIAVRTGVLSLIVLDASIASGFTDWFYGLFILALLPFSIILSRLFAVT